MLVQGTLHRIYVLMYGKFKIKLFCRSNVKCVGGGNLTKEVLVGLVIG